MSIASTASRNTVSVADREHFVFHRQSNSDELFISRPVVGRSSGRWTLQLTRKIIGPNGAFNGVVVASVDCYELSGFYQSLNLQQGFIELIGMDGIIRARGPVKEGIIGKPMPVDQAMILQEQSGVFRVERGRDMMTFSFRRLPKFPLVVLVGFSDKAILASYRKAQRELIWSGVAATLGLSIVGVVWVNQRKRTIRFQRSLGVTLESMSQGLIMIDSSERVRVVNRRALELLGLPMRVMTALTTARTNDRAEAEQELLTALQSLNGGQVRRAEDPGALVLESNVSPIPTGGMVQTITDVTARHVADTRILFMALHDHLTGLGNRVFFAERVDELLGDAAKDGGRFAMFCLDLNGFKKINDTFGHEIGDELLIQVGKRLTEATAEGDLVARTGGDEFAILTRLADETDSGVALARQILDSLSAPLTIAGQNVRVGVSIGIALYPLDGTGRAELLRNADLALYAAKCDIDCPVKRFDPEMAESARVRQQLEDELRAAIGTDQIVLEFQPQFRTSSLAIVGFEALVRWAHPVRGRMGPDKFIPLAEETGLIVALGRQVLEEACHAARHWPDDVRIAVNLSPVQFRDPKIIATVGSVLAETGLPASRLELEVTEGVFIADERGALDTLSELRELGVTLALDDFGTGYASLSYLQKFPFQQIKLDRSFVQAQVTDERSRHILSAVLGLSRDLKLSVVAEGVESRVQLHLLRTQGCHAVQGFLVGRPMSRSSADAMFPLSQRQSLVRLIPLDETIHTLET